VKDKRLTAKQLISKAYHIEDEDSYMSYINQLRERGDDEVFQLAKRLAYSKDNLYREISASILSQFGYKTKLYRGESIYLLGKLLHDKNDDVVSTAIYGFGHRKCTRYADKIASFVSSKSLPIKEALAFSLGGYEDKKSIDALILLMQDENYHVRNWSTFSLAQITECNTPKICDALYKSFSNEKSEIRGEALLGLALRKDKRTIDAIIEDLQKLFYGSWIFSAIQEMPYESYIPYFSTYIEHLDIEDKEVFSDEIYEAELAINKNIKEIK